MLGARARARVRAGAEEECREKKEKGEQEQEQKQKKEKVWKPQKWEQKTKIPAFLYQIWTSGIRKMVKDTF